MTRNTHRNMKLIDTVRLIKNMAVNDYKQKYASSALGVIWGIIPSLTTMLVYWFIFNYGFPSETNGVPYFMVLLSGLIPWFFFSDGIIGITNCYSDYSYLVKKVVFDISALPYVRILSSSFNHLIFIAFYAVARLLYGYTIGWECLSILYYLFCLLFYTAALGKFSSSLNVLFRDVSNVISVILQFGVWTLPILWQDGQFSPGITAVLKVNPLYYVVMGYKGVMLDDLSMLPTAKYTLYFWLISVFLFAAGSVCEKRLQKHFADLL